MKSKTIDFASSGLPYIFVTVPVKSSSVGEIIGVPLERIEKAVVVEIIEKEFHWEGRRYGFCAKFWGFLCKNWLSNGGKGAHSYHLAFKSCLK